MNQFTVFLSNTFLLYWAGVNLVCFLLFGIDKRKAIAGSRRIPERTLLLWAAIGGGLGGWLGMEVFRHKTRKLKFTITVPLLFALQTALLYYLYIR